MRCCGDDVVFARGHNQFAPFIAVGFCPATGFASVTKLESNVSPGADGRQAVPRRRGRAVRVVHGRPGEEVRAAMASSSPTHPWMVKCMGSAKRKKRKR